MNVFSASHLFLPGSEMMQSNQTPYHIMLEKSTIIPFDQKYYDVP
jgi:hypothetical protein